MIQELTAIVKLEKDKLPVQSGSASFFTPAGIPISFADMSKMEEIYQGAGYYATFMERRTGYSCDNYIATLKDLDNLDFFNDALWAKYNPWDKGGLLQKIEDREGEIRLVYSISEEIGVVKYYEYDYVIEDWIEIDLQLAGLTSYLDIDFLADVAQEFGHTTLDVVGFIPVVGEGADVVNGLWYLLEGEGGQATLCFASMIPVFGDMAVKTTKYTIKAIKAKKLAKTFELR